MTRPRLLLDLSAAFNQGAGIGRYARGLVGAAASELSRDFDLRGWYAPDASGDRFHPLADEWLGDLAARSHRSRLSRRRVDQLWFRLPASATVRALVPSADLVYSPDFTAPPHPRVPKVVTVHDLAFLKSPEYCPAPLRRYLTDVVPRQIAAARRVAAVSAAVHADVVETYGVSPAHVTVIPNAADERFFGAAPLSPDQRRRLGLPDAYLLTVGTLEPRKNHLTIFAAAREIAARTGLPLAVVGRHGWSDGGIREGLASLVAAGAAVDLTDFPDDLLPGLYAGASSVLQLSWHEGFSIPVVEALATGAPVVASDIAAHREVAGGAVTLVPPGDVAAVVEATLSALNGDTPTDREGRARAARAFSWARSGTMLAKLLREVRDDR